jgi:hypothetical protein
MTPKLPPELDLNLPDGKGVNFPPPVVPLEVYCKWLQEMHEDRVRRGALLKLSEDPRRMPVDAPFRLD